MKHFSSGVILICRCFGVLGEAAVDEPDRKQSEMPWDGTPTVGCCLNNLIDTTETEEPLLTGGFFYWHSDGFSGFVVRKVSIVRHRKFVVPLRSFAEPTS